MTSPFQLAPGSAHCRNGERSSPMFPQGPPACTRAGKELRCHLSEDVWDLPVPLPPSVQKDGPAEGQERVEVRSQDGGSVLAAPSPPLPAAFSGGSRAGTRCGLLLITRPGWTQGCSHRSQRGSGCPGQSAWELPSAREHTFNRTNLAPHSKQLTRGRRDGAGEGVLRQLSACPCSGSHGCSSHSSSLGEET